MKKTFSRRLLLLVICFNLVFFSVFGSYKKASALVTEAVAAAFAYTLLSVGISYTASTLLQVPEAVTNDMNSYQHGMGDTIMAACVNAASGGILHLNGAEWAFLKDWAKSKVNNPTITDDVLIDISDAQSLFDSVGLSSNPNDLREVQRAIDNGTRYFSINKRYGSARYRICYSGGNSGLYDQVVKSSDTSYPNSYNLLSGSNYSYSMTLGVGAYFSSESIGTYYCTDMLMTNGRVATSIDLSQPDRDVATAIDQNTYDLVTDGRTLTNIDGVNSLSGDVTLTIPQSVIDNVADTLTGVNSGTISIPQALAQVGAIPVDLATDKTIAGDQTITDAITSVKPEGGLDDLTFELDELFPFCIPFDLAKMFGLLNSSPMAPSWTWKFPNGAGGYIEQEFDLSAFDNVASVCRTMELLAFCVGLAFATRNLIRG